MVARWYVEKNSNWVKRLNVNQNIEEWVYLHGLKVQFPPPIDAIVSKLVPFKF